MAMKKVAVYFLLFTCLQCAHLVGGHAAALVAVLFQKLLLVCRLRLRGLNNRLRERVIL